MYIIIAVNSGKKDGMSVFTGAGVAIITPMKALSLIHISEPTRP